MCEYCKNIDTGNDWKPFISRVVDLGVLGKAYLETGFPNVGNEDISNGAYLITDFLVNNYPGEVIAHKKVKYCPMCGRKFE